MTINDLKKSICWLQEHLEAGSFPLVKTELKCRLQVFDDQIEHWDEMDEFQAELKKLALMTKATVISMFNAFNAGQDSRPATVIENSII